MANDEEKPDARSPRGGKDEAKLLLDLRAASIKSNAAWLRTIHQAKTAVSPDEAPGAAAAERGSKDGLDMSWLNDMVVDMAGEHLAGYNRALDLSAKYGDRFTDALRDLMRARRSGNGTVQSRTVLEIAGEPGKRAAAAFSVRNSTGARAQVTFSLREFTDVAGGNPFTVKVDVVAEPATANPDDERWLEPGMSRVFSLGFDVAQPFEPGHRYACALDVCVKDRRVEEVHLRVTIA